MSPTVFHLCIDRALLRASRQQLGWSISQAAAMTGLSRQTVASCEDGSSMPTVMTVALLCYVYQLPLGAVVKIEELPF